MIYTNLLKRKSVYLLLQITDNKYAIEPKEWKKIELEKKFKSGEALKRMRMIDK